MAKKPAASASTDAQPQYKVEYREIQPYGTLRNLPIALKDNARKQSVEILNQVLVDTMTLRDMYKKHHWQMSGATEQTRRSLPRFGTPLLKPLRPGMACLKSARKADCSSAERRHEQPFRFPPKN